MISAFMDKFVARNRAFAAMPLFTAALFFLTFTEGAMAQVKIVTVTASPVAQDAADATSSVAQVSRDELMKKGGFGLGDALKDVPGVTSSSFTAGAGRPVIRGFDASRVRITENGLGSHDVSDVSADHGVPIDPLSSIEVEVLRGPATLRYGSQAIGGVVNAINNRIPLDITEGPAFEAFSEYGTNADSKMIGGLGDYATDHFAFHADAMFRNAGSYDTPDGRQINTWVDGKGFALGSAYIDDELAGGFSFSRYMSDYGVPTEPGGEISFINLMQNKYNGALRAVDPLPGISKITATGGYSHYLHDENVVGVGVASTFINNEWEGRFEALHKGFGPITAGALGFQVGKRDFEAQGDGADYLLPTNTLSRGFYIFEEISLLEKLKAEASGRMELTSERGDIAALGSFKRKFKPLSFALGFIYQPVTPLSFSVNFSRTERAPNVTELFAQGPHEATGTFELGDPMLNKETSRSIEGAIRYDDNDGTQASFTVFRTHFNNFITGLLTGNSYDEDGVFFADDTQEFAELFYTQADATFTGFESQAHVPVFDVFGGKIGVDAQADYVRAKFTAGGNVPRIPSFRYGGGLFFERDGFDANFRILRTTSQDKLAANETPTSGYFSFDAGASLRVFNDPKRGAVDLSLMGSNLTNEVQRSHVSFTKDHVELPGRNIRLVLRYKY